jgi:hypothetical protein
MYLNEYDKKMQYLLFISIKFIFIIKCFLIINKNQTIIHIEINNEISYYEDNIDFSKYSSDIKAIALFLPQFHSIKENDIFGGEKVSLNGKMLKKENLYMKGIINQEYQEIQKNIWDIMN